jgi:hypothetical protein
MAAAPNKCPAAIALWSIHQEIPRAIAKVVPDKRRGLKRMGVGDGSSKGAGVGSLPHWHRWEQWGITDENPTTLGHDQDGHDYKLPSPPGCRVPLTLHTKWKGHGVHNLTKYDKDPTELVNKLLLLVQFHRVSNSVLPLAQLNPL